MHTNLHFESFCVILLAVEDCLAPDERAKIGLPFVVDFAVVVGGEGVLVHSDCNHEVIAVGAVYA